MKRILAIFMTVCLVFGLTSMSAWATEEPTWQEETPMPTGRAWGGACTVENKIYVFGGNNGKYLNSVEIYDTNTGTWSTGQSMPTARHRLTCSAVGDKIYAIGGFNGTYLNSVEIYDTKTDTWSTGQSIPTPRAVLTSSVVGDKIYVIGGHNSQQGIVDTVEIYDTKTDTWSTGQSMPTTRYGLTSSALGDKIYAIGGQNSTSYMDTVEIYDTKTDTWSVAQSMMTARYELTSSLIGNKIYAIGGYNGTYLNSVEIYDTETDTCSTGESMLTARSKLTSSVVGNKIYAIGGRDNDNNLLATVESLEVGSTENSSLLSVLLNIGETVQLSTSYDLDNNKNFTWSSTNEAVAVVDENGKVTGVSEGTANIYVQNADGSFKEYIPIKVVDGIADELRLAVHLKSTESANLYLADDPGTVTWSSMDDSIASVSADGKVTAVKKGLAIIKGELDGTSYRIYVRVNE
ncbi:kelch repeat-containing protein [Sinanaerobacter sp. ZZT-01]|uniref:Kelch repeat-containing protein n=1 Tax=Sinanaerobacter sp. ZZT-01 TaxID=3111540 RepID=UPI002D79EB2F|nr:kelch repeat-containing protein [Sinanaerobacter sp. ZZT-01]WRR92875.1 kelch repeat-containing protein [Sinanaerobacter sp. ZZT-01]